MAGNEWMARAACRGKGRLFFPQGGGAHVATEKAKTICATCPVFLECRAEDDQTLLHIGISEVFGTVAGRSVEERKDWQRAQIAEERKHKTRSQHRTRHQLILDLTYLGCSGKEVALQLGLTERSVSRCRSGACGLPGRTDREVAA